jgi:hypothetical protein
MQYDHKKGTVQDAINIQCELRTASNVLTLPAPLGPMIASTSVSREQSNRECQLLHQDTKEKNQSENM